ncbi:MAG: hypothetical protein B6243_12170 [Anaerolineaceae bacterium 4572_5.2]|nr:MAG: hypothetical protein B6243_12170 [Anaerolineaceae bacterium 4572_5.2]
MPLPNLETLSKLWYSPDNDLQTLFQKGAPVSDGYVLAIGTSGIDTKGRALAPLMSGTSNPGKIKSNSGGVARNIAENLARLGQEVIFLSAIGNDRSGNRIKNRLDDAGVDISHFLVSERHRTAAYLALFDENKSLMYSIDDMSVVETIAPQIIYRNRGLIFDADMVVLDSNLSAQSINSVVKQTFAKNIPLVADPTSTGLAAKLIPHLTKLYMITPNAAEAEVLAGQNIKNRRQAIKAAQKLVTMGVEIVVITLAEKGVVYATDDTSGHIPALTSNVVDLTGASWPAKQLPH